MCSSDLTELKIRQQLIENHLVEAIIILQRNIFYTTDISFTLVPSRYIEFVNRDENIDFDTKMKTLQSELKELLIAEEKSKADLLSVFKGLGYEIKL